MDFSIRPICSFNPNTNFMDLDLGEYNLFSNSGSLRSALPSLSLYTNNTSGSGTDKSGGSGSFASSNPQGNYFDYLEKSQEFYNNYNIKQQKMYRTANAKINAPERLIRESVENLQDKVVNKEQDQVMPAYNALLTAANPDLSAEELKAEANDKYAYYAHKTIVQDLREHSYGSFVEGLLKTGLLGFYNNKSAEDNISKITGLESGKVDKFQKGVGCLTGAAAWGTIGYFTPKLLKKVVPALFKGGGGNWVSKLVAAGAAGISLLAGTLFSK